MDPASATARNIAELTNEALPGLPMSDVDRIEAALLAELAAGALDEDEHLLERVA